MRQLRHSIADAELSWAYACRRLPWLTRLRILRAAKLASVPHRSRGARVLARRFVRERLTREVVLR